MKARTKVTRKTSTAKVHTRWSLAGDIVLTVLLTVVSVLFFSALWLTSVFHGLSVEEVVFHIKAPLTGTSSDMVAYYILHYGIVEFLLPVAAAVLLFLSRRDGHPLRRWHLPVAVAMSVLCLAGAAGTVVRLENNFAVGSYLSAQKESDAFIEDHYVDPSGVEIRFSAEKRNLIYIYLESVETTYADRDSGGAFTENCIPELTELALANECFNGGSGTLNGGTALSGTVWTMGAIFGQSAGLPLKLELNSNDMSTQEDFFPGITTLGDILEREGYTNEFLIGSNAEFGGRRRYFSQHGDYRFFDYEYARENGYIPQDYKVWWGYEDEKLFAFAKDELKALAAADAPFNLTLLTVDTHFEDGYVCRLCGEAFAENQYANVFACSSRQVADFVKWVQSQDFYENTTIVIVGDHPTMDSDFCADVPSGYERKVYTAVINGAPAARTSTARRAYDTFDFFPTTLAALGAQIEGDRLGLGVNLYSDVETLVERMGVEQCNRRLGNRSAFMEELSRVKLTDALLSNVMKGASMEMSKNALGRPALQAQVQYDCSGIRDVSHIEVEYWNCRKPDVPHRFVTLAPYNKERGHYAQFRTRGIAASDLSAVLQMVKKDGSKVTLGVLCGELYTADFHEYLSRLAEGDYLVFVAACDEASTSLDDTAVALLGQIGAKQDLRGHFRASYVLVADTARQGEKQVYEEIRDDGAILHTGQLGALTYTLKSAGYDAGNYASIVLDGKEYSMNSRGLNIVVYDRSQSMVIDSACFDTYDLEQSARRG